MKIIKMHNSQTSILYYNNTKLVSLIFPKIKYKTQIQRPMTRYVETDKQKIKNLQSISNHIIIFAFDLWFVKHFCDP